MPSFTNIPTHVIIMSVTEGILRGKEAFSGGVVSTMIKELNGR